MACTLKVTNGLQNTLCPTPNLFITEKYYSSKDEYNITAVSFFPIQYPAVCLRFIRDRSKKWVNLAKPKIQSLFLRRWITYHRCAVLYVILQYIQSHSG